MGARFLARPETHNQAPRIFWARRSWGSALGLVASVANERGKINEEDRMRPMDGMMMHSGWVLLNIVVWILVVAIAVIALWRGMRAQERIAGHLEEIARSLGQRPGV